MTSLFSIQSGFGETQGRRDTMEDAHVVFDDILKVEDIGISSVPCQRVSFYGVYDGHGGVDTAKIVQSDLHKSVVSKPAFASGDIVTALKEGFAETDEKIVKVSNEAGWMNGSTGVVAVMVDAKLYIANVGDSEACLVSVDASGKVATENLTTPHKASDPVEKKRVEELGGHVFFGRVFGALAVSRSFGDSKFKKPKTSQNFVSCEPAIQVVDIRPDHKFLILACDGLWDVMTHDAAAEFANNKIAAGESAEQVSHSLVSEALRKKTEDNVTVVVVIFSQSPSTTTTTATTTTTTTSSTTTTNQSTDSTNTEEKPLEIPTTPVILSSETSSNLPSISTVQE